MPKKKRVMIRSSLQKAHHPQKLRHRPFWLSLLLIFLISMVVILSLSSQQSLTGHATVQPIAFAKAGSSILVEVNVGHIKEAVIFVKEDVNRGKIIFKENPQILFNGRSLSEITFSVEGIVLSQVDLTLKIKGEDMTTADLKPTDVMLYLNDKGIATKLTEQEGAYYYYSASINDAGNIVIGKKAVQRAAEKSAVETVPVAVETVSGIEQLPEPVVEPSIEQPSARSEENIAGRSFWQKFLDFFS